MGKRTQTLDRGTLPRRPASRSRLLTVDVETVVCGYYLIKLRNVCTIQVWTFLRFIYLFIFISPLFNQIGQLRTSSYLQLRPGQDKAKQCDTNTELHME